MNTKVYDYVKKYLESQDPKEIKVTEEVVIDAIRYGNEVWKDSGDKHRWFIMYRKVVEVGGMFIGFLDAEVTGDDSVDDQCPFDPSTIQEYEPKEKMVIVYEPKK